MYLIFVIVLVIIISAMFTFYFCPKLQDKHCKNAMTMTRKTRYMPQVTNDKINLNVYKKFCQNPTHLNDPLYCRCVEQAATLSHLQFMFSRYSFLSKVLSANSPDEWEGTKLINVLLPSWSILVYKKYATIFAQRCFSSKLWLIYCKVASINTLY